MGRVCQKKQIVLAPVPYSDLSQIKYRPVLILHVASEDAIVCALTSKFDQTLIKIEENLPYPTYAKTDFVTTLKTDVFKKIICNLSESTYQKIVQVIIKNIS